MKIKTATADINYDAASSSRRTWQVQGEEEEKKGRERVEGAWPKNDLLHTKLHAT